ncbi:MAG: hypothetical protein JWN93_193 [Hyphomicrobiales bacterium]|nr:hypothetical protein [Hyphomicrobiales bacterium]
MGGLLGSLLFAAGGAAAQQEPPHAPSPGPQGATDVRPVATPVVIELFTSQGCSSCPPADKLISQLARQPNVFALSMPVDYWDYIGWKDTLALPAHTRRQRHYAAARGDGNVYTPQAVINGVGHAVGSDPAAIKAMTEECYGKFGALSVPIKAAVIGETLRVDVPAAAPGGPDAASVWVARVSSRQVVTIGRGENSGRTLEYANVSRGSQRVGEWKGEAQSFEIPADVFRGPDSDGWMVFLQRVGGGKPGPILAAAKSPGL